MYGYIYETTNLINGKKYVGQKKSNKFLGNLYLGSGKILRQAVKLYGKENFKVKLLYECNSKEELDDTEIKTIKEYKNKYKNKCYNISTQAATWNMPKDFEVWNKGIKLTEEHKRKVSESTKEAMKRPEVVKKMEARKNNYLYGNSFRTGKPFTKEQKEYISKRTKEAMSSLEVRNKIKDGLKNRTKKEIEIWRQRQANAHLGKISINKLGVNKQIDSANLQKYLDDGWSKGISGEKRLWIKNKNTGECIMILENDLQKYLDNGWTKGRITKNSK